jgi:hypothetical protein
MSHKRGRRGRRTSNPGAVGQVALGIGGFAAAGLLGALVRNYIPGLSTSNAIYGSRALTSAIGAGITAMIPGDASVTMPLAAGMAANAGVQLMSLGATASGMTLSNQKFLGLTSTAAPSASAAAASSAAAVSGTLAVTHTPGGFVDSTGVAITAVPIASKKVTDSDGNVTDVDIWGAVKDGKTLTLTDDAGNVWIQNKKTLEFISAPSSSLSGTYPPWAGYPGYDKRNFPQQVVSLPSQVAPHVQGYANYAPAMNGYANFAPAMSGWSPGYSD